MDNLLMALTVFIIIWSLHGEAIHLRERLEIQYPPCVFNPLCTCSKAFPDLGKVMCKDLPLYRIPIHINISKVYMIHLENNGLRSIEPHFLRSTGLYSIEISHNSLTEIPAEAFAGLERSLWELVLHHNRMAEIPGPSFRHLKKLKSLDLSDNEITFVSSEDWKGLEESLEMLSLKGNGIIALQPSSFAPLRNLQILDLSGNSLFEIDGNTFKDGPFRLLKLSLADNLLSRIPYQQLSPLKFLRDLDLSLNRISEMHHSSSDNGATKGACLNLDTLRLDYNKIQFLPTGCFKHFAALNRTYFNGNPISKIQENAFRDGKVRELILRDCAISELSANSFDGLENHLEILDLSGNNITGLPQNIFKKFDSLRRLSLEENPLGEIDLEEMNDSLEELDLRGIQNPGVNFRNLERLGNIRALALSTVTEPNLSPENLNGFSIDFEELRISDGNVKALKNHAFRNVRRLKRLDLSENSISTIESKAFAEVGHFLQYLCLANALAPSLSRLSSGTLKYLTALQHLDVSNNNLKHLEESSFYYMNQLKVIELHDNRIESIQKRTFQNRANPELSKIYLSFNQITAIQSDTFVDLDSLEVIQLDDNQIRKIGERAFANLIRLKYLNLRGNKISLIAKQAFENLPEIEHLDLAFNNLMDFSYSWLDQVGILSSFALNISHNVIGRLAVNASSNDVPETMHVNVKIMDFSHNNITYIGPSYFKQVELSITHLFLCHNSLWNLTGNALANMMHLQWLDLSHNFIKQLDLDVFRSVKSLQVLKLSNNHLIDIPRGIFDDMEKLRVVEMENNMLKTLPDMLFQFETVEKLVLSGNQLIRVPVSSFKGDAAASLLELDLSNNLIMSLHSVDIFVRFQNLQWLDLSSNPLIRIENGAFSHMARLNCLDLSHNIDMVLEETGKTFYGLDDSLEDLYLRNLSLGEVPQLHLPHLKNLDLSDNKISSVPASLSQNLPSLRRLELSGNKLTSVPLVISSLTQLQYLGISNNAIDSIAFHRGSLLKELDMRNLPITYFETGILDHLQYLKTIRLSLLRNIRDFNLPRLLQSNHAIENLYVESLEEGPPLGEEIKGIFPSKMHNLHLTGKGFKVITSDLLKGISSPRLNLVIFNTSVEEISEGIFENAKSVRNMTLDVRSNNLRTLGNPNSGTRPNLPRKTFLLGLKMADNKWKCDCELGWIEGWDRSRRQHICEELSPECYGTEDDLRMTECLDKNRKSVLEELKTELECGWNASGSMPYNSVLPITLFLALLWRREQNYLPFEI